MEDFLKTYSTVKLAKTHLGSKERAILNMQIGNFITKIKKNYNPDEPLVFWFDLFCGAGGTSSGVHYSGTNSIVAACVNHDRNAILSHEENHPDSLHFIEDIRDFKVVIKLRMFVEKLRIAFPDCVINLWASLECTNFSKAKGGLPRDADSRTLAEHMFMYLHNINPDYFWVENVREFLAWGPLDENGKPVSRTAGKDYLNWIENIKSYGYQYDKKILNSADYGAYQARQRLFIQFSKNGFPISWPEQTHTKDKSESDLFPMPKWKPVKDVLDLSIEGESIFTRKKPLSENTLKRILAGLIKFVANGEEVFIKKYYSGRPAGKVISVNGPAGTVTTIDGQAIVSATHLNTYYGNSGLCSIESPSPTVTTKDRIAKVDVNFLDQQYGNSSPASIESPCNTLTANPKFNLVNAKKLTYLVNGNSSTATPNDIENPSPTITSVRTHYLVNPQFSSKGSLVNEPSPTIIARQDKKPLSVVNVEHGNCIIYIFEDDNETMIKIKEFMAVYGIIDIKMRMLNIPELKQIQGFPKHYKLVGTQTEQKKQIGNAVEVTQAKAIVTNNHSSIKRHLKKLNQRKWQSNTKELATTV